MGSEVNLNTGVFTASSNLTDLLFHNKHAIIENLECYKKILVLYKFLLHESLLAAEDFLAKNYANFDAQVGENLCQIRAVMVYDLVNAKSTSDIDNELTNKMDALKLLVAKITNKIAVFNLAIKRNNLEINKQYAKKYSLITLLKLDGLVLECNQEFIFLIKAHFLSRFSVLDGNGIPYRIDFARIMDLTGTSKHHVKRTVHYFQAAISAISTKYLTYLINHYEVLSDYAKYLPCLMRKADEGRSVFPCYDGMNILLHHLNAMSAVVLIKVYYNPGTQCSEEAAFLVSMGKMKIDLLY